eukprot:scaffold2254_cov393-Prasinococcus_capsulatus_cf.AAC.16
MRFARSSRSPHARLCTCPSGQQHETPWLGYSTRCLAAATNLTVDATEQPVALCGTRPRALVLVLPLQGRMRSPQPGPTATGLHPPPPPLASLGRVVRGQRMMPTDGWIDGGVIGEMWRPRGGSRGGARA